MRTPVLIFDLDETLYPEESYVKSGYKAVAARLYEDKVLALSERQIYLSLEKSLKCGDRFRAFQNLLISQNCFSKALLRQMIKWYRSHVPNISCYQDVLDVWPMLAQFRKYIVTDGNALVQEIKVRALEVDNLVDKVFVTHRYGLGASKPNLKCFDLIRIRERCAWEEMVYVGDDPSKDFVNLNAMGATTVRVRTGRFANVQAIDDRHEATIQLETFAELPEVIKRLEI